MQEAMDLSTAGEICYLVIIGSEEENNFVKAQKGDDTRIWTGGVEGVQLCYALTCECTNATCLSVFAALSH